MAPLQKGDRARSGDCCTALRRLTVAYVGQERENCVGSVPIALKKSIESNVLLTKPLVL